VRRYVLAPEAEQDLDDIKDYLVKVAGVSVARYVLRQLKDSVVFLGRTPGAGHVREDLTDINVKFWPVFSYLIIYRPASRPIEIVRIIHGNQDIARILGQVDN
jgi:toxin ParE1/3/4